ncbi:mitochondrial import inner membrane translocase subunit tim17 protein [Cyclospora cayetanensis]|uniref:Mitochondrial import inner membrane translocase subunit tim17 protein n=1 Tax=Cyclospora cayetanensis TaxID=88456 RepID=A0A1D3D4Y7_9EIME|nr:mitochondrial import inner membrane translocase subunit tim17 protein [Cyclospora cayetanensis]
MLQVILSPLFLSPSFRALLGGSFGFASGVRKGGPSARLRLNAILNGCGTYAPAMGSQLGTLSLFYCCFNNLLILVRGDSEVHAPVAGGLAGCLYKVQASWRVLGAYGAASAVAFSAIDQYMRRYL